MNEMLCEVELDQIRVSPFQPRQEFTEQEIGELAHSIKSIGLLHPPVVRKIEHLGKILYYELVAGERRWRAAQKAGLHKMTVLIKEFDDANAAKATLIENVQRVDLNPLETAYALKKLIEVFQMTQEEVAEKVGKKRSTVANYLRLLSLPPLIQKSLSEGSLTMGHAKAILSLESDQMQEMLHQMIIEHQMTVRQTEEKAIALKRKKGANSTLDVHQEEVLQRLQEKLGTKIKIHHSKKNKGSLQLYYSSTQDLERLLELLGI